MNENINKKRINIPIIIILVITILILIVVPLYLAINNSNKNADNTNVNENNTTSEDDNKETSDDDVVLIKHQNYDCVRAQIEKDEYYFVAIFHLFFKNDELMDGTTTKKYIFKTLDAYNNFAVPSDNMAPSETKEDVDTLTKEYTYSYYVPMKYYNATTKQEYLDYLQSNTFVCTEVEIQYEE